MQVEVDQSNRVDESGPTFVALANDSIYAIKVPSAVKEAGRIALRGRGIRPNLIDPFLWAGCAFLLLKPHLKKVAKQTSKITIDNEFEGYENDIKDEILRLIRIHYQHISAQKVVIDYIGKKSPAHKKALAVKRGKKDKADRTVTVKEMMRLWGK